MSAIETQPQLSELAAAVRGVVDPDARWAETAELVAAQLRRHLPTPEVLTPEQRLGSADGYRSHTLHVERDGSFSIIDLQSSNGTWLNDDTEPSAMPIMKKYAITNAAAPSMMSRK